ncbi:MAG: KEOPS complex kinase/ATPase Bud32 [Nitrosopumilaceae archaeon]|nr:KEOPS complex kinase/ATPase Bud32 [Nitrosopumilaceae archaeon]
MKLIKKGAEADIYSILWKGNRAIKKIRKPKKYRNLELDSKIRKHRTFREAQTIMHVKSLGVPAPLIYFVNAKESFIIMQEIPGKPVHDLSNKKIIDCCKEIGKIVGTLHKNDVMHGDLTTSNFILFKNKLYVIDFGLSQKTEKLEDCAVDLRLIKEILNSAHAQIMKPSWNNFLKGYKSVVGQTTYNKVLHLVSVIESRGRYATVV